MSVSFKTVINEQGHMEKDQPYNSQVMIIDSDKYVRESLITFFDKAPLRVLVFKTASEGLNALKYQDIDMVVSDYFLSDMDGLSFLKQVAIEKPDVHRVLMATITSDEMTLEIARLGIDNFIEKPLSIGSLETIIREFEIEKISKLFPGGASNE